MYLITGSYFYSTSYAASTREVFTSTEESGERKSLFADWLDLTTARVLPAIPGRRYNSQLAFRIIQAVARLECPDLPSISDTVRTDRRKVQSHIEGLKTLFVLNELYPRPAGVGKALFFLCDVGLSRHLGASFEKQVWTCALNELLAESWFSDTHDNSLFYFRSRGGSFVHLVKEDAIKLTVLKIHPQRGCQGSRSADTSVVERKNYA